MAPRAQGHAESGSPRDPISAAGAAVCGVLENGVRTAYAVIDEYMRRGQNAARATYQDFNKRGAMNQDRPNFGGPYTNNPWGPMSMMMEQFMMAMRMWNQAMSSFMPGAFPQAGMYPAPFSEPAMPSVAVKVSSVSPVEVELTLYPGPDFAGLCCDPLRAEAFAAPPMEPATIEREQGGVRLAVKVGAAQAKGRYHALVRRETDRSVAGELVVTVS
jgi:hypothetical protein